MLPLILRSNLLWIVASLLGAAGATTAIILSGTRGIWLALIVIVIMLGVQLLRQASIKKVLGIAIISTVAIGISLTAVSDTLTQRYQQTVAEYNHMAHKDMDTSIGIRLQLWQRGLSYIKQNPLLGTGTEQYLVNIEQDKQAGLISPIAAPLANAHFHNQFIDTLVRTGALGLLLLLAWMFIPAWTLHKQQQYPQRNWALACGIVMLIGGLTDVPFHHTHLVYFYSMLMGAILMTSVKSKE
ncbi:O-antigen ligase family protein [Oceanisphaera avium]|nr:O-antigen ligase family protein [Oceanisphaera avium]